MAQKAMRQNNMPVAYGNAWDDNAKSKANSRSASAMGYHSLTGCHVQRPQLPGMSKEGVLALKGFHTILAGDGTPSENSHHVPATQQHSHLSQQKRQPMVRTKSGTYTAWCGASSDVSIDVKLQ